MGVDIGQPHVDFGNPVGVGCGFGTGRAGAGSGSGSGSRICCRGQPLASRNDDRRSAVSQTHYLDKNAVVDKWDRDAPPALTVAIQEPVGSSMRVAKCSG